MTAQPAPAPVEAAAEGPYADLLAAADQLRASDRKDRIYLALRRRLDAIQPLPQPYERCIAELCEHLEY